MKAVFDNFVDFEKEKPSMFEPCLFVWNTSHGIRMDFGIWNGEAFFDGAEGHYMNDSILKWESIHNCKFYGIFL